MKRWMSLVGVALCGLFLTVGPAHASGTKGKKKNKQEEEIRGTGAAPVSGIKKRRSIFADENSQGESEEEYRRRVKKEQAAELAKQRKAHNRKQMKSKGKALDGVKHVDDDDPLSGI